MKNRQKQVLRAKLAFLAAGIRLPPVRRSVVTILIQQQGELSSGNLKIDDNNNNNCNNSWSHYIPESVDPHVNISFNVPTCWLSHA